MATKYVEIGDTTGIPRKLLWRNKLSGDGYTQDAALSYAEYPAAYSDLLKYGWCRLGELKWYVLVEED